MVSLLDPRVAEGLEGELQSANALLAREEKVTPMIRDLIDSLAADFSKADPERAFAGIDPYLAIALQQGAIDCLRAMHATDAAMERRLMRVGLERMRQALRDIAEGMPTAEDRPAKDIVWWLVDHLDVTQHELAELLGTSIRTFQRWASRADPSAPTGDEAYRLRVVARIANHLRHALTGPGVVRWFTRRHPALGSKRPADLLEKPEATERLVRLAASARSSGAA